MTRKTEFRWSDWLPPCVLIQCRIGEGKWFTCFPWDVDVEGLRLDRIYWRLCGISREFGIENL